MAAAATTTYKINVFYFAKLVKVDGILHHGHSVCISVQYGQLHFIKVVSTDLRKRSTQLGPTCPPAAPKNRNMHLTLGSNAEDAHQVCQPKGRGRLPEGLAGVARPHRKIAKGLAGLAAIVKSAKPAKLAVQPGQPLAAVGQVCQQWLPSQPGLPAKPANKYQLHRPQIHM